MSGPEGGVGSDDGYYYSLAAPVIPRDFPTRAHYGSFEHAYANIFKPFANLAYDAFGSAHILDLIFLNLVILSILPFAVRMMTQIVCNDKKIAFNAFLLSAICPFLLANKIGRASYRERGFQYV